MKKIFIYTMCLVAALTSCSANRLPIFSNQSWHIDHISGNAVSSSGMIFGFGSEWLIRDTTLIQTPTQMQKYPKLESYLAKVISQFPEISIDSIYFFNPARRLLFAAYHQEKALKPTSDIKLYNDSILFSGKDYSFGKDYTRIFGDMTTHIEDTGWETGPAESVYTNLHYNPKDNEVVLLQRIPYKGHNIAVFHIWTTIPKKGEWWNDYPRGMFSSTDLGNLNNLEIISTILQSSRTTAVSNLNLSLPKE